MNSTIALIAGVMAFGILTGGVLLGFYVREQRVLGYNRRGLRFKDWQMWNDAVRCFEKGLRLDGGHALSHYNLGFVLYFGKQLYDQAVVEFEAALRAEPRMAPAHYALGHLLFHKKGDINASRQHLQEALKLDPKLYEVYNTLGLIEIKQEKWHEAMQMFGRAVELHDTYDVAVCNLAIACMYQGKTPDAIAYAERCVTLQPESTVARKNLGNIYGAAGRRAEAIYELKYARRLDPHDWIVHFWLGCLYLQSRTCEKAVLSFHEALRLRNDFALAYYNLALCYEAMDERGLARKHIDRAIELNPELGKDLV